MLEIDRVVVIDTGLGNVASIVNMLRVLRVKAVATADPVRIEHAERVILPGVGTFDAGMRRFQDMGLIEPLIYAATQRRIPVLGICLGMQLLTEGSEEGSLAGLGLVPGRTCRIPLHPNEMTCHKLPHMGWNAIDIRRHAGLYAGDIGEPRFYFVHSYHVVPGDIKAVTSTARHGSAIVTASIQQNNILGVQFHPEKSHRYGLWLMANFLRMETC